MLEQPTISKTFTVEPVENGWILDIGLAKITLLEPEPIYTHKKSVCVNMGALRQTLKEEFTEFIHELSEV